MKNEPSFNSDPISLLEQIWDHPYIGQRIFDNFVVVYRKTNMTDTLIIGAGQSGLTTAHHLKRLGKTPILVDAGPAIGHSWSKRYDSLALFTPARYSSLPGLAFPLRPDEHPRKDEVAGYFKRYAQHEGLDIRLNTQVTRLSKGGSSRFQVETTKGVINVRNVVIATGLSPRTPTFAEELPDDVRHMHSEAYRREADLVDGDVLVVGAGNSGVQIAEELSCNRRVYLSADELPKQFPQKWMGRDVFFWLILSGFMRAKVDSGMRAARASQIPIIGTDIRGMIQSKRILQVAKAVGAGAKGVELSDGSQLMVPNVIWATGYHPSFDWVDIEGATDAETAPVYTRGVSPADGLYWVGFPWLYSKGSGFMGYVSNDARFIAKHIVSSRKV